MTEDRSILAVSRPEPNETICFGDPEHNLADVWHGGANSAERPLVLIIHGGFWRPEHNRFHTRPMSSALATAGWTVAAIEYRRNPGEPHHTFDDVALAVGRVPELINDHSGNTVLIGHSAGGHLALWVAASPPPTLQAVVALAPVADLQLAHQLGIGRHAVETFLGATPSSMPNVDPRQMDTPPIPVTLVHGTDDEHVPVEISESYRAAHPAAQLVTLPGAGHFALIDPLSNAWPSILNALQGNEVAQ